MEPEITQTTEEVQNDQPSDITPDTVPVVDTGEQGTPGEEGAQPDPEQPGDVIPDGEPKPDDAPTDAPEFYFGDLQVEIDIPQDVTDALSEKGLDAAAIAAELYGKGGEFKLSEETLGKLYEAFGKFSVDAYLSGLKATNDGFMHGLDKQEADRVAADTERYGIVSAECGGDEGWGRLETFALETLSQDELDAFNAVMASGNQYLQQYAVRELEGRRKAAQGDDEVTLIQPDSVRTEGNNGPLTAAEYMKEISSLGTKFGRDRVAAAAYERKLDERRRAGIARGI